MGVVKGVVPIRGFEVVKRFFFKSSKVGANVDWALVVTIGAGNVDVESKLSCPFFLLSLRKRYIFSGFGVAA